MEAVRCPQPGCSKVIFSAMQWMQHDAKCHPDITMDDPSFGSASTPSPGPALSCPKPDCSTRPTGQVNWQTHVEGNHPELVGSKFHPQPGYNPADKYRCLAPSCEQWFKESQEVKDHVDTHPAFKRPANQKPGSLGWDTWGADHPTFEEIAHGRRVAFGPQPDYRQISRPGEIKPDFAELSASMLGDLHPGSMDMALSMLRMMGLPAPGL